MAISQHSKKGIAFVSRNGNGRDLSVDTTDRFPLHDLPRPEHPFQPLQVNDLVLDLQVSLFVVPHEFEIDYPNSLHVLRAQVRRLRQLLHPFLFNILAEGEEKGMFFFSEEPSRGEPLSHVLRERKKNHQAFSLEEALGICWLLCRLLDYVNRSVPHGFLNSQEVFLQPWPDGPIPYYPRIALPGIRFAFRHTTVAFQGLDEEASCYAPPEFTAEAALHQRADVYGLGALLYSLLTLRPPTGCFIRPSRVRPGLPEEVDRILLQALEEDPAHRFASPQDLAASLQEHPELPVRWEEMEKAEKRLVDGFRIRGVLPPPSSRTEADVQGNEKSLEVPSGAVKDKADPSDLYLRRLKSVCLLVLIFFNLALLSLAFRGLSSVEMEGMDRLEEYRHWERFFLEKG